jgi:hypothetical protein
MEGLTEGRIVHFVLAENEHRPAIVVKVWRVRLEEGGELIPPENGCCNLQVFTDGTNDRYHKQHLPNGFESGIAWKTSVVYSESNEPGTWHWIEKA